jgi:hypothetical protein
LQGQDRIFTFFCKFSHAEKDLEKVQVLGIKRTNCSAFLLMSLFDEIFVKNVWKYLKTAILLENFVKNDLEKEN